MSRKQLVNTLSKLDNVLNNFLPLEANKRKKAKGLKKVRDKDEKQIEQLLMLLAGRSMGKLKKPRKNAKKPKAKRAGPKRKLSQAQLNALARGRAKRKANIQARK